MAITIDTQVGDWCLVTDSLANIITALSENVVDPKNVVSIFHDGSNYHLIFKRQIRA